MLKVSERDNYVIVSIQGDGDMRVLVDLVKKYPGKQILVSVGHEITAEEIEAMQQDPLDFGKVCIDNLLLSFNTIGGDYSGDASARRAVIPPTPSNNPQIGRFGQMKRPGRKR